MAGLKPYCVTDNGQHPSNSGETQRHFFMLLKKAKEYKNKNGGVIYKFDKATYVSKGGLRAPGSSRDYYKKV